MIHRNNFTTTPEHPASLGKRMLAGAGIALILIAAFLIPAPEGKPEWGSLWMIKPLLVVPLAGAIGGAFFHLMDPFRRQGSWKKFVANIISLIVFLFLLWIGTVLGLNGTMWN